jgi:TonB-dependent starch-binding outer membrane protein SusC
MQLTTAAGASFRTCAYQIKNKVFPGHKSSDLRQQTKKLLLAMKLTAFILLTACLTAAAAGHGQGVTLNIKDAPLEKVFNEIRKQTGYNFLFSSKELKEAGKVTVRVSSASIETVLALCFKDKPFSYVIENNNIVIRKKQESPNADDHSLTTSDSPLTTSLIDITGKVTDADGNPLAGATVKVNGTSKGTTTNNDGVFVLKGVDENATLEISFVGYETYMVAVNNKTAIVASLKLKPESLNEIIINKGYYTERQKYSVSNVGKVTAKDIERQPVTNPLLALQGRVPGLFITQANGLPGSGVKVRIQGQNSLLNGNDPLYIIDGIPYPSQSLSTMSPVGITPLGSSGGTSGTGGGNLLSYLNQADIESVEILKDADATAIYGSRAANGAILITTKKGKAGDTKVNISASTGWGKVTKMLDLMNTQQYLEMRREAFKNDGAVPNPNLDYDLTLWDTTRYTDWQKTLIGGTAKYNNINASVSGGNNITQFFIGSTYQKQTTVFPGDFSDQKGSIHFNINNTSLNKKFSIQLNGNYMIDDNQLLATDLTPVARVLPPDAPALYNANGTLNWMPNSNGRSSWINPLKYLLQGYQNKAKNLLSNLIMNYELFKGLNVKTNLGYNNLQMDEFIRNPIEAQRPESRATAKRSATFTNSNINSWIIEPQLNYDRKLDKLNLGIVVGSTFQEKTGDGKSMFGSGQNSDAVLRDIRSATSIIITSSDISEYKYNALFGRLSAAYFDKYIFSLTARRDGSSRFGSNNQLHNFYSIGAGWIFSNEKVFGTQSILSFGKIKGSYGTSGNDQIGDYAFMNLYSPYTDNVGTAYQTVSALEPNGLPNPYLQWEETKKLQLGINLGFLEDRILVTADYVMNKSSNQLLYYSLPILTGFPGVLTNFPATVQNKALEFSLIASPLKRKNFSWTTSLNFTLPKNKLTSFPDLETSTYNSLLLVGQPVSIKQVYELIRVNPNTGIYEFGNGKNEITTQPDTSLTSAYVLINTDPKIYGGFQNTITYKSFEFDFFFQFVKQVGTNYLFGQYIPGAPNTNQPTYLLNRWQKPGDITGIRAFTRDFSNGNNYGAANQSDKAYSDASYVRLKNISISWGLPKTWQTKVRLGECSLFLQGQNLLTITKFKGIDPENQSVLSLPPLKVLTVGVKVGF